jgi:hypothetical protein
LEYSQRHDCEHRIEADKCESEYDALLMDACALYKALASIRAKRPNKSFDPWAVGVATEALRSVSERVRDAILAESERPT